MKKEDIVRFYLEYRMFIFPAVTAILSLIFIVLVIYPQTMKLLSNQKAQVDITTRSSFLEEKAQELENYNQQDLNNKVNISLNSYPADKDFANVIGLLQNMTSQLGFTIVSLSLGGGTVKAPGVQSYSIKLDLLGPLAAAPVLVNNIEQSPRLMKVSGIETSSGGNPNAASITLSLEVLYSPAISSYGSVDSPLPKLTEKDQQVLATLQSAVSPLEQTSATSAAVARGRDNPFQ